MNFRNFNMDWLDPLYVLYRFTEWIKVRQKIKREQKEYKIKKKQGLLRKDKNS